MARPKFQHLRQPMPDELRDSLLALLRSKFYNGEDRDGETKAYLQDRVKLLKWVVLMPADWLASKGVTIHGEEYRQIFVKVFLQAAAHVTSKVNYRPAYLRQVIQQHMAMHGEEIYQAAKSVRNLAERIALMTGKPQTAAPDPVAALADARRLIQLPQRKKKVPLTPPAPPVKEQLNLF